MARAKSTVLQLEHQRQGTSFLRRNDRAGLFDEQGLGKSKQLIDAVSAEVSAGTIKGALIVCPNGLKSNWAAEVQKFSGLSHTVFGSGKAARRGAFAALRATVYIINYEAVPAELPSLRALLQFKPMAMILDESHRIKSPAAKVTRAIHSLRALARRRYILSGTPVANKPEDLWAQMYFLDDGQTLGSSIEDFQRKFKAGKSGYQRMDELRDRVAERTLRRTKDSSLKLPPKSYERVIVEISSRQREMYEQMREDLELWVRKMSGAQVLEQADAILSRLVRLAQLASNPHLIDADYRECPAKFDALDAIVRRQLSNDAAKIIIWTSFVGNIRVLLRRYKAHHPVAIYGDVDSASRDKAVKSFKDDPSTRIMVANPAAAREGLTLTEANMAVYLDRTFNLVDYLQSQDRIHRISQTKPCKIMILIAKDTVDEFIDFSLEQKHRLAKFAQRDTHQISAADLSLAKPSVLKALLSPTGVSRAGKRPTSGVKTVTRLPSSAPKKARVTRRNPRP